MPNEHFRYLIGYFRCHDEIKVADGFFPPPIASGDTDMQGVRMRAQIVLQRFRFTRDLAELKNSGVFGVPCDRLAKLRLRRFSETREIRDLIRVASCLQLCN